MIPARRGKVYEIQINQSANSPTPAYIPNGAELEWHLKTSGIIFTRRTDPPFPFLLPSESPSPLPPSSPSPLSSLLSSHLLSFSSLIFSSLLLNFPLPFFSYLFSSLLLPTLLSSPILCSLLLTSFSPPPTPFNTSEQP